MADENWSPRIRRRKMTLMGLALPDDSFAQDDSFALLLTRALMTFMAAA
jgi:hypothetical protein